MVKETTFLSRYPANPRKLLLVVGADTRVDPDNPSFYYQESDILEYENGKLKQASEGALHRVYFGSNVYLQRMILFRLYYAGHCKLVKDLCGPMYEFEEVQRVPLIMKRPLNQYKGDNCEWDMLLKGEKIPLGDLYDYSH